MSPMCGRTTINYGNKIVVDLLQPVSFRTTDDETGLLDKLKTAREFAKKLTDNDITISFLRRGKEAITLGKDAKPRLSKIITRSDEVSELSFWTLSDCQQVFTRLS